MVNKYKEQCLPKKARVKYSRHTPMSILRTDYATLLFKKMRNDIKENVMTSEEAKEKADLERDEEFEICKKNDDFSNVLDQLNKLPDDTKSMNKSN